MASTAPLLVPNRGEPKIFERIWCSRLRSVYDSAAGEAVGIVASKHMLARRLAELRQKLLHSMMN